MKHQFSVRGLIVCVSLCIGASAIAMDSPHSDRLIAGGLVESDIDTMRVVSTAVTAGDSFFVEIFIHNVDTLGAYAFRIAYDPAVITPLLDHVPGGPYVVAEQLRGASFEQFAGGLPSSGIITFAAVDFDPVDSTAFHPGTGVAVRMSWEVNPLAATQTTTIAFENHPQLPASWNAWSDYWGLVLKRPVLQDGAITITELTCYCPNRADHNTDGVLDSTDLATEIDIVYFGTPDVQDPKCPSPRGDFNADGYADSIDIAELIEHVFFGGSPPSDPCLP